MIDESYFDRKRRELGMDREDTLAKVQQVLDGWYPDKVRARRLHLGVLHLVTPSASVAGMLRLRQSELFARCGITETRLAVRIASLENRGYSGSDTATGPES